VRCLRFVTSLLGDATLTLMQVKVVTVGAFVPDYPIECRKKILPHMLWSASHANCGSYAIVVISGIGITHRPPQSRI